MQTGTQPIQPYPEGDEESWDLQFDGESVEEPAENERAVPFRPIGLEG